MKREPSTNMLVRGYVLGLLIGAAWGVIMNALLDAPVFIAIGAGAGMCLGLALGRWAERKSGDAVDDDGVRDPEDPGGSDSAPD